MIFKGVATAIITPFNKDLSINYIKFEELINMQIKNNVPAIVVCGTTGESSTLTTDERKSLISFAVKVANKRIKVIANTGTNDTTYSILLSRFAEDIGADAILAITPYYNKSNKKGLYMHFKAIASSINIPVILYNVPSRTNIDLSIDIIVKLSKIPNIVGIKEASSDINKVSEILKNTTDFAVYCANDSLTLPTLSLNAHGVISVFSNAFPKELVNLCDYMFNNNFKEALNIHYKYLDIMNNIFIEVNPIPIKEVMNFFKYDVGDVRLPLYKMNEKNKNVLIESLNNLVK